MVHLTMVAVAILVMMIVTITIISVVMTGTAGLFIAKVILAIEFVTKRYFKEGRLRSPFFVSHFC